MWFEKLKWFSFLSLGVLTHILVITIFYLLFPQTGIFKGILIVSGFIVGWSILTLIISGMLSRDYYIFLSAPLYIFKKRKWVYHNKLGWFLIFINPKNIDIFKVNIFYLTEKSTIQNTGKVKEMAKIMKVRLDDVYKNFLIEQAERDAEKMRMDAIKNWDGLLIDDDERRDLRIDNILKNKTPNKN
jgi:hypothetical protein